MRFLHLRYAVAVDDAGSFTEAARRLYISQPTVSAGVREVEKAIGFSLFEREHSGVTPTPAGKIFLARGREIIRQMDEFEEEYVPDPSRRG